MQTETISLDEFFNKYKSIMIYKIEYLIGVSHTVNDMCIHSFDGDARCGYREELVLSKDDVKKYDNLFLRPDNHTFVSGVVIDDMVFCIIGDLFEEEDFDDYIVKSLAADPDKNMYDIHVEFVL